MIFRWLRTDRRHLSHDELSAYVDGAPGAPSEPSVRSHLAACDGACIAELDALRATVAILRSVQPVRAPRSFAITPEMIADLPDAKPLGAPPPMRRLAGGSRIPVWAPAFGAAAAAVVFAVVLAGNLAGAIDQGSTARESDTVATFDAAAGAAALSAESAGEVPEIAAAAAAAEAEPARIQEMDAAAAADAPRERVAGESAVAPEAAISSLQAVPPAGLEADASEPESALPSEAPQPRLAEEELREAAAADETPLAQFAPAETVAERLPGEDAAQTTPLRIIATPPPADDSGFPVWQTLLGTGLAALALGVLSLAGVRRRRSI